MERPVFDELDDATAWVSDDAIARASLPFRSLLGSDDVESLEDYLGMLVATHPVVQTLLSRAARELVPARERSGEVATKSGDHDAPSPRAPTAAPLHLEPTLAGRVNLDRPELVSPSLAVVRAVARYVADAWERPDYDALVGDAWVAVLEIAPDWDGTESSYVTLLWCRVRSRLVRFCERLPRHRETPAGYRWSTRFHDGQLESEAPVERLYEAVDAAAMSYGLALLGAPPARPDEARLREASLERVAAARRELPERQEKTLELHYEGGRALRDVANELGVSMATAERDHQAALVAVRRALDADSDPRSPARSGRRSPLHVVRPPPRADDDRDG